MKLFDEIEGLVSSQLNVIKTLVTLVKMETRLAGLSVLPFLVTLCFLLLVLMATWLSISLLLGYFFLMAYNNILFAILFIVLLNGILGFGLIKYLLFNLKKMSFEKTREYFSDKESIYNESEKKIDDANRSDEKHIVLSTRSGDRA